MKTKICQLPPVIILITAILVMMPAMAGVSWGQMVGGQHFKGEMVHSMGMMSDIMKDMHQIMRDGQLTSEQQQEIKDMMAQMSQMMREMLTPQPWEVGERQHRQLQEMQRRLNALKKQVQKQKKGPGQPAPEPQQEEHKH